MDDRTRAELVRVKDDAEQELKVCKGDIERVIMELKNYEEQKYKLQNRVDNLQDVLDDGVD